MTRVVLFVAIALMVNVDAFLIGKREAADCLVSHWSEWSEPYGFGTISRERVVLRNPQKGGVACPSELEQTQTTGTLKQLV